MTVIPALSMAYASSTSVWTDEPSYPAESLVRIYGAGFNSSSAITITVSVPNNTTAAWEVVSDGSGGFATTYQLDSINGTYYVSATDGTHTATTSFVDATTYKFDSIHSSDSGGTTKTAFLLTDTVYATFVITHTGNNNPVTSASGTLYVNKSATCVNNKPLTDSSGGTEALGPYSADGTHTLSVWSVSLAAGTYVLVIDSPAGPGSTAGTFDNGHDLCSASFTISAPLKLNPTVSTQIINASNNAVVTAVPLSSIVHDNATVTGSGGTPTGSVTFYFFTNGACTGAPASSQSVGLTGGKASSSNTSPLTAGAYSFNATYGGDTTYNPAKSSCESLSVGKGTPAVNTDILNGTDDVVTTVPLGTTVHDSVIVAGVGPTPTGVANFTFYSNGECSGEALSSENVALVSGGATSSDQGPLAAGNYAFKAHYYGDSNYIAGDSACEPLTVNKATPSVDTEISPDTTVPLGTIVNDTATTGGQVGAFEITGVINFTFYSNGVCEPFATDSENVTLFSGAANSSNHGPLAAGTYSFMAHYYGDSNYYPVDSPCEPLTVTKANTTTITTVYDQFGNDITGGTVFSGTFVHDNATVGDQVVDFVITGTVTFYFYTNGGCTGVPSSSEAVVIIDGSAMSSPQAPPAGSYSYNATYSGDSNYNPSKGACEQFDIAHSSGVTTPAGCSFDTSSSGGQQFKLIFTPDLANLPHYKLFASNPGQFAYNVFVAGPNGYAVDLTVKIPYPFVTQGSTPIQVFSNYSYDINGCLVVSGQISPGSIDVYGSSITTPSGSEGIGLGTYSSQTFGTTATIHITGTVPSTGLFVVTIHLDYGLKSTTGWDKSSNNAITNTPNILDGTSYTFSVSGNSVDTQTIQSNNVFKNDPGFAGLVLDQNGNPVSGVKVQIRDSSGKLLGTVYTDQDGWYMFFYKYTGKGATFKVTASYGSWTETKPVYLKSNQVVQVNFIIT